MKRLQKYIAVFLLTSIILPVAEFSLVGPWAGEAGNKIEEMAILPVALAAVPVIETNPSVISGEIANVGEFNLNSWWKYTLLVLLENFKIKILDMMVKQIVSWVAGGATGKPQFITNWQNFLGQAATDATNIVINEVDKASGGLICTPFANQLRNLLRPPAVGIAGSGSFQSRLTCSMDTIVNNINAFYRDFSQGGWSGYLTIVQPNNNFYGNAITILDANQKLAQANQVASQNQGISGQGYLSTKRCKTPLYGEFGEDTGECAEYELTTPGKAIGESVDRAIGNRIDYIVNSTQIATIVAVVIDGFINKLIGAGTDGLLGYGTTSASPGSGYIASGTNTTDCTAMAAGPEKDACLAAQQATSPSVSLSASATTINPGESFALTWSGVNSTSCTGTNFSTGGQYSGSVTLTPAVTITYDLTCTNTTNQTITKSVTVTVTGTSPAPQTAQ